MGQIDIGIGMYYRSSSDRISATSELIFVPLPLFLLKGAGVESMTMGYGAGVMPEKVSLCARGGLAQVSLRF